MSSPLLNNQNNNQHEEREILLSAKLNKCHSLPLTYQEYFQYRKSKDSVMKR